MKYTPAQKTEALKSIEKIGVAKTAEELKMSVQTLYKWRNEAKAEQPTETADTAKTTKALSAKELLESDHLLQEKIAHLEAENKGLRTQLTKYRAALAAALEEGIN